ncbi:uncharacterized protein LOC124886542 [Capsicum annuum]|uniref:uncharacterized protein LOC124886542 n=1 Tax=Capsicum annuum TaxID=4072 RepID=UPI001FB099FD|nr:uncharacterized protein LOC124886542 [Capsicum annuum]
MQNPKNGSHCLAITNYSVKATIDPPIHVVDESRDNMVDVDKAHKAESKMFVTSDIEEEIKEREVSKVLVEVEGILKDMRVIFVIDTIDDDAVTVPIEERLRVEALATVIIKFDSNAIDEIVSALYGRGADNTLSDVIIMDLLEAQVESLILVLQRYKRAIEWAIAEIVGIPLGIFTHKIHLEPECIPSIEHQRQLNPPMQEFLANTSKIDHHMDEIGKVKMKQIGLDNKFTHFRFDWWTSQKLAGVQAPDLADVHDKLDVFRARPDHQVVQFDLNNDEDGIDGAGATGSKFNITKQHKKEKEHYQDMAHLKTQMDLLTKHLLSAKTKKVKVVASQGRDDSDLEEEANYLNNQGVSKATSKEIKKGIFLRHKISENRIEVDRAKVEVIKKLPPPISVKGVQSFLGHAGFNRRFIKDFSKIANPLCELLDKEVKFSFDDNCLKVFECLKGKLVDDPIIVAPDWSKPFEIMCDASSVSLGVVMG